MILGHDMKVNELTLITLDYNKSGNCLLKIGVWLYWLKHW